MRALLSSPGALWPWLGILAVGMASGLLLVRAGRLSGAWLALAVLPLGVVLYAGALVPAMALLAPAAAVVMASIAASAVCGGVLWRVIVGISVGSRGTWIAAFVLLAAAVVIARAGSRYALAVLVGAEWPAILGEPSTGDWGLHSLRVAMIARHGLPPPSPLDPDYPLHYRYLFHVLAGAFASTGTADYAQVSAGTSGLVLAALVLAGGALAWVIVQSPTAMVAAGLLSVLAGPTYWLVDAIQLTLEEQAPTFRALSSLMGERWALSPLTPSFPSVLSAQGSSPGLPFGVLCWLVALMASSVALRGTGRIGPATAAIAGIAFACVGFAADFFAPLAVVSVVFAGAVCRRLWMTRLPGVAATRALVGAAAAIGGLGMLLLSSGQFGLVGSARDVRLSLNESMWATPVYGGNHALLAGGQAVTMPNMVQFHDWGLLFWPGALLAVWVGLRRANFALLAGGLACVGSALFWHVFTVSYLTTTPTDFRVQMYRYASMATAVGASLLPCVAAILVPAQLQVARALLLSAVVVVSGGAGAYLVLGSNSLVVATREQWIGDASLAGELAREPAGARLAVLGGAATFVEMYNTDRGGYLPLWWALGGASVPVGWDFGRPEYYEPLYRRVVQDFDPQAAAELRLTHVAMAPAVFSVERRNALDLFLDRCAGREVAVWRGDAEPEDRRLLRINHASCAGGSVNR